jgi:P27 family predicted phage terminase small subunit
MIAGRPSEMPPPEHLTKREARAWNENVPTLMHAGLLDGIDAGALEAMAKAMARAREAAEILASEGLFVESPNGYKIAHPAVAVEQKAWADYARWCGKFGLTPADRIGLGMAQLKGRTLAQDLTDKIGQSPRGKKVAA